MMSSKATSAERAGCLAGDARFGLPLLSAFFVGTSPSLSALLGLCAEAVPSGATSARRYEQTKRIFLIPRVVAEFEFVDVERQISRADLVEIADDAALDEGPEAFNILGMNRANNIFPFGVVDNFVRVARRQAAITNPLIRYEQCHFLRYGLTYKAFQGSAVNAFNNASGDFALPADRANDWSFAGTDTAGSTAFE